MVESSTMYCIWDYIKGWKQNNNYSDWYLCLQYSFPLSVIYPNVSNLHVCCKWLMNCYALSKIEYFTVVRKAVIPVIEICFWQVLREQVRVKNRMIRTLYPLSAPGGVSLILRAELYPSRTSMVTYDRSHNVSCPSTE